MELLFVVLGGAIIGAILRYVLPRRHTYGSVLTPAIGAGVAAVIWVGLTWLEWRWNGGWIWVWSFVFAGVVCGASALLIGRYRERSDSALFERLARPGVASQTR